jgi:GT2 family glycosyltransferase
MELHPHQRLSIAVLLTNYNSWHLAQRCVDACFKVDPKQFEKILVYDDCSTAEFTGIFPEGTQLHRGCPNRGLTKSLNVAFSMLDEDVVVLFDSDAYPLSPFCESVRTMFTEDTDLGLVALRTVGCAGMPTRSYEPEPNVWSLLLGQVLYAKLEHWLADRSGRISVYTCAMAVRMRAFDEISGFDEAFDWLDLDHDFSMRMNRSRWKVAVAREPRAFHEGGGTSQLTRDRVKRFYKNRWYLLEKFNRIPLKKLVQLLILIRLWTEYTLLRVGGRFLFPDEIIRIDKITGRRDLIQLYSNGIRK